MTDELLVKRLRDRADHLGLSVDDALLMRAAADALSAAQRVADDVELENYRLAPSGVGPLAAEWADKPHRLIYDLVNRVKLAEAAALSAVQQLDQGRVDALAQAVTGLWAAYAQEDRGSMHTAIRGVTTAIEAALLSRS